MGLENKTTVAFYCLMIIDLVNNVNLVNLRLNRKKKTSISWKL